MQVLWRECVKFLFLHKKRRAVTRLMGFRAKKHLFLSRSCVGHLSVVSRSLVGGEVNGGGDNNELTN